jgi:iron(III) transport system substrate-binding protein
MNRTVFLGVATASAIALSCGTVAHAQDVPEGYPGGYADIIEASQQEDTLSIYSNVDAANWAPFLELVTEIYPWMTVETTDDNNMWEKYYAETLAGVESADMVLASHPDQWAGFIARDEVMVYESPEAGNLPAWSMPAPGVYSASADPMIMANARSYFEGEPPRSLGETAQLLAERPELQGKVAVMDPIGNLMGYAAWASWLEKNPDGWKLIEQIGSSLRPERSAGTVREKLLTGEYAVAVFTSGGGIPRYEEPVNRELTAWGFSKDGTPVVTRNVAITNAADSPNSAKLVLDLLLSREGQIAFASGGLTPYREDVALSDVPFITLGSVRDEVGEENILLITPVSELLAGVDDFEKRWNTATGK